jgi:hypothetical protein
MTDTNDTNPGLLDVETLNNLAANLEEIPDIDLSSHDSEYLADLAAACKRLENAAEDARKDGYEDELDPRVDEGESIGPLTKQQGASTWVEDTEGAFAAVAETGEDPLRVASVNVTDLREVLGEHADEYLGQSNYTYFRR